MGIFSIFKKSKQIEENEVVSKGDLLNWLLNKKKEHYSKEQEFITPIKERISQLISELKEEIIVLENVDFEKKKVDSRVKLIVKENLRNYVGYLQKMIERLGEVNKRDKMVDKINFIFEDFNKKSKMSYEKITFIVGKEMQATKDSLNKFLKDLERILKSNKKEFEEFETIGLLEEDVKELKNIEENKAKVLKILNEDIEKIENIEQNLKEKEREVKEIKQSDKFKQEEEKRKERGLKKQELEKNILDLFILIDFKALSSFYHKFESEMELVKEYKNQFKYNLQRWGVSALLNLIQEAKLENEKILNLTREIDIKEKQILDTIIDDFGIDGLEKEIIKDKFDLQIIESEKSSKEKKLKSLDQDLNKALNEIKDKLEKIDVELN